MYTRGGSLPKDLKKTIEFYSLMDKQAKIMKILNSSVQYDHIDDCVLLINEHFKFLRDSKNKELTSEYFKTHDFVNYRRFDASKNVWLSIIGAPSSGVFELFNHQRVADLSKNY